MMFRSFIWSLLKNWKDCCGWR